MLSFFPRDVLDEILDLIESVSEGFPPYSLICIIKQKTLVLIYTLQYFRQIDETTEMTQNNQPASFCESTREASLFKKLKTGLDSARSLIKCLRSEKGRLMKRELSVEMRLGEMEDYKSHIKQDLVSV